MATLNNVSLEGGLTIELEEPNIDQYYNLAFLLPGVGANNGTNNTFLDSSSNNLTLQRVGTPTQGSMTPFSLTGWSNHFDGLSYLTISDNAAFNLGSDNFTIEFFVNFSAWSAASARVVLTKGWPTINAPYLFYVDNTVNRFSLYMSSNGSNWNIANGVPIINTIPNFSQWYHIALVRNGNIFSVYVDGVRTNSFTSPLALFNATGRNISIGNGITNGNGFEGYISNLRIVKGQAIYNGEVFLVPSEPLDAPTGTFLLTCQSNRFINNGVLVPAYDLFSGGASVQSFSPFLPEGPYNSLNQGGSGYFNSGIELLNFQSAGSPTSFLSATDFTAECWFYRGDDVTQYHVVFGGPFPGSGIDNTQLRVGNDGVVFMSIRAQPAGTTPAFVCQKYAWNHIVWVRSGVNCAIFVNGVRQATSTNANQIQITTIAGMRDYNNQGYNARGLISGARITSTAVYNPNSATIDVPTSPPADIPGTYVLSNFVAGQITDVTSKVDILTVNDAKITDVQSKWGTSSIYFDGNDYIDLPNSPLVRFGFGDFTIEFWIYLNTLDYSVIRYIMGKGDGATSAGSMFSLAVTGENFSFYLSSGEDVHLSRPVWYTDDWMYVAIVRQGTNFRSYFNGFNYTSFNASSASSLRSGGTNPLRIGSYATGGFNGYMNDLRFSYFARYTGILCPIPTKPFPTY